MQFESFGKYQSTELHSSLLSAVSNFQMMMVVIMLSVVTMIMTTIMKMTIMMMLKIIYVGAKLVAEVQG